MCERKGLAKIIKDDNFTREQRDAICKYVEELKNIEDGWHEIKNYPKNNAWQYCATKYFDKFCNKNDPLSIRHLLHRYINLLLFDARLPHDDTQYRTCVYAVLEHKEMRSNFRVIKKLIYIRCSNESLDLLRKNTCTQSEKYDLWKFAIAICPVYIIFAPVEMRNDPCVRTHFELELFGKCYHYITESLSQIGTLPEKLLHSLLRNCYIVFTSDMFDSNVLTRLAEIDGIKIDNKNKQSYLDLFWKNENFIDKLLNGSIKPCYNLCMVFSEYVDVDYFMKRRTYDTGDIMGVEKYCGNYHSRLDQYINDAMFAKMLVRYPYSVRSLDCQLLRKIHKITEKTDLVAARRSLAIVLTDIKLGRRRHKRCDLVERAYESLYGVSADDEYKNYINDIKKYDFKNFENDVAAQYDPRISAFAVELDEKNRQYVKKHNFDCIRIRYRMATKDNFEEILRARGITDKRDISNFVVAIIARDRYNKENKLHNYISGELLTSLDYHSHDICYVKKNIDYILFDIHD